MQVISGILFTLTFLILLVIGVAYSGYYDVTATTPHVKPVSWLLGVARHKGVERHTYSMKQRELIDAGMIDRGAEHYDQLCAGCHGAPGQEVIAAAKGMYPKPPELKHIADHMDANEIFYVTKFGLKMTGMPAWGVTQSDEKLWEIVAFVTQARNTGAADYQALIGSTADRTGSAAATTTP